MPKTTRFFIAFSAILCYFTQTQAQVEILEKNSLAKIQNGNTHVIVNKLDFPHSDEFLALFKKYWTVTKGVDFISVDSLEKNLVVGDSYFSLEQMTESAGGTGSQMTNYAGGGSQALTYHGGSGAIAVFYLKLWIATEKTLKEKKVKIWRQNGLAHIVLSPDISTMSEDFSSVNLNGGFYGGVHYRDTRGLRFDLDGAGHIYHWNPGLIKNYLMLLSNKLKTGKKENFKDDITDEIQLQALKLKHYIVPWIILID